MNNGKQPITPTMYTKIGDGADDYVPLKDGQKTGWEVKFGGLTKREFFAGKALQGLLSNADWAASMQVPDNWYDYVERVSSGAVEIADALIKALDT